MSTARLEAGRASVSVATTRCHSRGPQMIKFEQVSSDHHQMLIAWGFPGLMFGEEGVPYLTFPGVPCRVTYPMMHLMLPTPSPTPLNRRENITFPQLRLWAVTTGSHFHRIP